MKIAVIPARGGSKRIPRKNIKPFCGKPMIAWSIEAARASGCFDRIIVSTDDDEIAAIAQAAGAEVPFRRPAELAGDYSPTNAVVVHAVEAIADAGRNVVQVACIYATAPFLTPEIVREGMLVATTPGADFSATVTRYPFPIQRALAVANDGLLQPREPDRILARSQDLGEYYHDAGQLYCGAPASFARFGSVFQAQVAPVVLPRTHVQDIDTPEDWEMAEALFKAIRERQHD